MYMTSGTSTEVENATTAKNIIITQQNQMEMKMRMNFVA